MWNARSSQRGSVTIELLFSVGLLVLIGFGAVGLLKMMHDRAVIVDGIRLAGRILALEEEIIDQGVSGNSITVPAALTAAEGFLLNTLIEANLDPSSLTLDLVGVYDASGAYARIRVRNASNDIPAFIPFVKGNCVVKIFPLPIRYDQNTVADLVPMGGNGDLSC